jgi:hypothetical protein
MALDLRNVQKQAASIVLTDRCNIWRDPEGSSDDVMDPATLSYDPNPDAIKVHSNRTCGVKWLLRGGGVGQGGQPLVVSEYEVKFEQPFIDIKVGDRIEMLTCIHDPRLIGKSLFVIEVLHGSLAVFKKVRTVMREEGIDLP